MMPIFQVCQSYQYLQSSLRKLLPIGITNRKWDPCYFKRLHFFDFFYNFLNFPCRPRRNNMIEKTWWFCDSLNIYISNFLSLPHESSVRVTSKNQDEKWKFPNRSFFQEDLFRAILAFWWPFFELHEHTPSIRKSK